MIKVGVPKSVELDKKGRSLTIDYEYKDIDYDEDGWADAKKFMPADFDLCLLKIKDKKSRVGWASGNYWDGLHVNSEDEVLYWKKQKTE